MILMDINLPGISGIEALHILRDDPATATSPSSPSAPMPSRVILKRVWRPDLPLSTKPIKVNESLDTLNVALEYARKGAMTATEQQQAPKAS